MRSPHISVHGRTHIRSVHNIALAAVAVTVAPVVIRQMLDRVDQTLAAAEIVGHARHVEIYCFAGHVP